MNKVLLTGRITKDPEIRYTASGMANLRFTIAVDKMQKDANGQRQADFISCVAFGQQADFISRYVHKGNMLGITGRITTGQFQGQDGQMRYTTDVAVENVENLTPRDPNQAGGTYQQPQSNPYQGYNNPTYGARTQQAPQYQQPQQSYQQQPAAEPEAPKSFGVDMTDDDIPF